MSKCIRSLDWCDGPQKPDTIFSFLKTQCGFCKKARSDFQKQPEEIDE